jgi:arylsulfatase A-like enzyme
VRGYYRLIAGLDDAVGDLVAALAKLGLDWRTVVVFTSDNGLFLGEHGLSGKWLMYDESVRVPLIVRDPSSPAASRGRRERRMTLNLDLAPTLLDFARSPAPQSMQGASLRPLLAGQDVPWREDWYYEYRHTARLLELPSSEGVRTRRWAYARYVDVDPPFEQLFDLAADPREERNLAGDAAAAKTLAALRSRCRELREAAR